MKESSERLKVDSATSPSLIRLRPKPGPVTSYEVAEILNLQTIREAARKRR